MNHKIIIYMNDGSVQEYNEKEWQQAEIQADCLCVLLPDDCWFIVPLQNVLFYEVTKAGDQDDPEQ